MRRRKLLDTVAVAAVGGLAGCLVTGGDGSDEGRDRTPPGAEGSTDAHSSTDGAGDANGTEARDGSGALEVIDSRIETRQATCADHRTPHHDWTVVGDVASISGRFVVPNPCHEAVLSDVHVDGETLAVTVSARSTLEEGAGCAQCVGEVHYAVRIEVSDGGHIEEIIVDTPARG